MAYNEKKIGVPWNEYVNIHRWVRKTKGAPTSCTVDISHQSKRFEWSNVSGKYDYDETNYISLCVSCHRSKDYTLHQRNLRRKAWTGSRHLCKKIIRSDKDGSNQKIYDSVEEAAKDVGIVRTAIGNCLRGLSKTSNGYKWRYLNE